MAQNVCLRKKETSQINKLLQQEPREKKSKYTQTSRRREKIKELRSMELKRKKRLRKINDTKSWFFKMINKIDSPLICSQRSASPWLLSYCFRGNLSPTACQVFRAPEPLLH
jgi:hypothetical protein